MTYDPDDWPHGLRCMDCDREFVEGMPISQRIVAMSHYEDEPAFITEIICSGCVLGK